MESEKLLGALESFVGSPSFTGSTNAGPVQQSLKDIVACSGDLNVLRVLSDLTVFSEDLKVPKQKKGIPMGIPQESEIAIYLRHTSLKVLCGMCLILSAPNAFDQGLAESFASVASLAETICLVVENLRIRHNDPSTKDGMLQEGIWGLKLLMFLLRNCPSSISVFRSGYLLETLREFLMEEALSVFCLQILEIISLSNDSAFINFMDEELVAKITDAVLKATEESTNRADVIANGNIGIVAATPGKGKSAKKEKGNYTNDSSSLAVGKSDKADMFRQTRRQKVACIKLAAKTLTAICDKNGQALSEYQISRLVVSFSKVLSDKSIWELTQAPIAEPYDISLVDTIERCCVFMGALGLVHCVQRKAACDAGCMSLLLTVLQNSMLIFNCMVAQTAGILQNFSLDEVASNLVGKKEKGSKNNLGATLKGKLPEPIRPGLGTPAEEAEKLKKVRSLRRASEKALMSLLSERSAGDPDSSEPESQSSTMRWHSAAVKHSVDLTLFYSVSEYHPDRCSEVVGSGVSVQFPMSQLMEVVSSSDIDLGNRGLRIFSAILEGVEDPESLINDLNLDAVAIGSLSTTLQIRAMIVIDLLDIQQDKKDLFPEGNIGASTDFNDPKAVLEVDPMDFTAFGSVDEDVTGIVVSTQDSLQLSETEALYLALLILEKILRLSSSNVNIFATRDRLGSLASLLYRCGAIGGSEENFSATSNTSECIISLADPRNHNWYPSEDDVLVDKVLLRPLIFYIVGIIASSEEKYRSYEGTGPVDPGPCGPLVASSSPCREAALSAAKLCGDAAVSVLLVNAKYSLQQAGAQGQGSFHIVAQAKSSKDSSLQLAVQDGALRSLLAMIRSGAIFLYAVLESVAEAGFYAKESKPNNNKYSAMTGLRHFLGGIPGYAVLQETDEATYLLLDELQSSLSLKTVWARALLFDQLFTGSTFCTTAQTVLTNPAMWPYISICTALMGVISSVDSAYSTVMSATEAIMKLCRVDHLADFSQPVVADSFCAFFLGLGGATALSGSMGRFGTFRSALNTTEESMELHDLGLAFLKFLVGRGREREVYWLSKMPAVSSTPLDPKSQKAATAAKDSKAKEKEKIMKDQKKGKSPVKAEEVSVVEDVAWNLETDGTHPDPNHGPTRAFWKDLLEGQFDELHTLSERSNLLLVTLQGGLSGLVCDLVEEGAGVHIADMYGVTPLMYALLLGDEQSAAALISAGADVDAIDAFGNPVITSACHSASPADIDAALFGPVAMAGDKQSVSILGSCQMLPLLLAAGADTHVCSSSGNSPILSAMGLGSVTLSIGGYQVTVGSSSYSTSYSKSTTRSDVESLLSHGALVNACNHNGVVPLHIAAARGHRELIDLFKHYGVFANAEDSGNV
jgi:Ankyrin repeat